MNKHIKKQKQKTKATEIVSAGSSCHPQGWGCQNMSAGRGARTHGQEGPGGKAAAVYLPTEGAGKPLQAYTTPSPVPSIPTQASPPSPPALTHSQMRHWASRGSQIRTHPFRSTSKRKDALWQAFCSNKWQVPLPCGQRTAMRTTSHETQ